MVRGETEGTVEFTGANTFFGKTASLLGGSTEISNLQKTLIRIMIVLVVLSLALCITVFIYLLKSNEGVIDALSFTVVLLVASIPLAIEIVTTTTLALGSKELSHHGAIVTRLSAIEDMAGMAILCRCRARPSMPASLCPSLYSLPLTAPSRLLCVSVSPTTHTTPYRSDKTGTLTLNKMVIQPEAPVYSRGETQ